MIAPDSLKTIINDLVDRHWEDVLQENEFSEVIYDNDFYFSVKVSFSKESSDGYVIRITPKCSMINI